MKQISFEQNTSSILICLLQKLSDFNTLNIESENEIQALLLLHNASIMKLCEFPPNELEKRGCDMLHFLRLAILSWKSRGGSNSFNPEVRPSLASILHWWSVEHASN